jgi:peptide/nickel transport system permease protein
MLRAVAVRLGVLALSLLGASLVIFLIAQALPGDVARVLLGEGATDEQIAAKRHELGTDRPLTVRYFAWLFGMLRGDFGQSYFTGQSVSTLIEPRLGVTIWLVLFALLLAVVVAVPLGMLAALKRRSWQGFTVSASAQVGMAIPAFWAGILLVLVFSVWLRSLPANGYQPPSAGVVAWARHLVLPVCSLGLVQAAVLLRYVRSAFVEVLHEDWYRTARSVGWTQGNAMLRHGLRNASASLVTVLGLQLASVLVGAIVIEQVFVLPGLGSLLLSSVARHDLMVVQGIVMLLVLAVLVINALVEVSYVFIDPRLRTGSR